MERRQRVAPAFILNNFLMKTAIPSNDLSRVQARVPPLQSRAPHTHTGALEHTLAHMRA